MDRSFQQAIVPPLHHQLLQFRRGKVIPDGIDAGQLAGRHPEIDKYPVLLSALQPSDLAAPFVAVGIGLPGNLGVEISI